MYNPEFGYGTEVYETEEERRRRLAAEAEAAMPVKQTITYDPKTGAQKVKIEGGASSLTSANPATPTVTGPVSPDETYQRMIQAESGGRQFNAQGGVLTSPKGALGVGQVMPATAMQPGYGVTNIFDLARQRGVTVPSRDLAGAQQLLGNEQLNREFGQNYYNAMNQRFGSTGGVAAYNAGPGRVQANMAANAGQLNTAQLPDETQQYIQRVLGRMPAQAQAPQPIINDQGQVVGSETPAQMVAGAQTNAPVAPAVPGAQTNMMQTQAAAAPQEQMGPSTQFMSPEGWIERFQGARGDIGTLSSMLADPNLPKGAQMEIAAAMSDQMRFQKMEAEKREEYNRGIETGRFPREDRKTDGGGSWLRYFMYGLMGSPNAEIEKQRLMPELYAKPSYVTLSDGQTQAVIMRDNLGNVLRGTTADGRPLTQKELIENAQATEVSKYKPEIGGAYVKKDDAGNIVARGVRTTKVMPSGKTETVIESGGRTFNINQGWEPESISTQAEKSLAQKRINLNWDPIIKAATTSAEELTRAGIKYGVDLQVVGRDQSGQPIIVDKNTNQVLRPNAQGQVSVTTGGAVLPGGTQALETKAAVSEASQKIFAEKRIPEIIDEGDKASTVARIRRQQLDVIRDNPTILGIYQGQGDQYGRARQIITNVISGAYGSENDQRLRDDLKALSISPAEKAALEDFANMNMQVNTQTLKANTGGGQIAVAEQKINKEANLSNIAEQTALASLQGLHRSLFASELGKAKSGFLTANEGTLNTDAKFASAWNKQSSQANKAYEGIMRERARFLQTVPQPPRNATPQQIAAWNERVFKAFEMYPAPRWDSEQNKWNYGTKNAEEAAARAILGQ